jgi:hypothetical protein
MKVKGVGRGFPSGLGRSWMAGRSGQTLGGPQIVGFGWSSHGICARGGVAGVVDVGKAR